MSRTLSTLVVLSGIAFGVVTGRGEAAPAQANPCLADAAAATLSLTPEKARVTRESGPEYAGSACKAYVIDVAVKAGIPKDRKFGPTFALTAGDAALESIGTSPMTKGANLADAKSAESCDSFREDVTVYRKVGEGYIPLFAYARKGEWTSPQGDVPGACNVTLTRGSDTWVHELSPPSTGTEQYRIVAAATMDGKPRKVKVAAQHTTAASGT